MIEFKAPGGALSPKQAHVIGQLRQLGHDVQVHDTVDGALCSIETALQRALLINR